LILCRRISDNKVGVWDKLRRCCAILNGEAKMTRWFWLAVLAWLMGARACFAGPLDFPKRILYVGNLETPRQRAFVDLLEKHFLSDSGGYRWYIDPLAKKRGVKSSELRGPLRADRLIK
jgi:hypothetical protein